MSKICIKTKLGFETFADEEALGAYVDTLRKQASAATWCYKHSVQQPCQFCPDERIVAMLGKETTLRSDLQNDVARLKAKVKTLFDAIAHGDDKHREWLANAIKKHFEAPEIPTAQTLRDELIKARDTFRDFTKGLNLLGHGLSAQAAEIAADHIDQVLEETK